MSGLINAEALMAAYLALCILLAVVVHFFRAFDQRELASVSDEHLAPLGFFERPDRALLILLFGLIAMLLAAYLGWRLPVDLLRFAGLGGEGQSFLPVGPLGPLGRAAQVIGAICFVLIALRLMRLSLIVSFALTMVALTFAAYGYVFS